VSRLTCLSVIGTRPEAIKMAPVIRELARQTDRVRSLVCATGQHSEMLEQVLTLFNIVPDVDLRLMRPNQSLAELTAALLSALDGVVSEVKPHCILAQGDTTTLLATSLVAYYRGIPFGHVEAGLRTGDVRRPFPEEMNRRAADITAAFLFAPTERSRQNLLREGYCQNRIFVTGNTVVDAVKQVASWPVEDKHGLLGDVPPNRRLVLITAHRRESFGEPFRQICEAIRELAQCFGPEGVEFIYPVHLNPNVREPVLNILGDVPHVKLTAPVDYQTLIHLMKRSYLILTDSGGIQEEAPAFGVPVLVLRDTTERPEGIESGVARLAGTRRDSIVREARRMLVDKHARASMATGANPYGDGFAAQRIVRHLLKGLS
jgi:UDP-N-acetylglucosamine 2-epimerase (non-hydrolysing)